MTLRYAIKDRLPPPFPKEIEKILLHCTFSRRKTSKQSHNSIHCIDLDNFYIMEHRYVINVRLPTSSIFKIYRNIKLWQNLSVSTTANSEIYFPKLAAYLQGISITDEQLVAEDGW
ncbi:hypothetical protein AVEN_161735-1 [Araneus ventricosus]|uniref:Uncharacterized protein n=1 Tax=Araneus ventricosus TaxID=182803 RepID=A0A4Y2P0E7_ARAVE|nr:hypothetical protein AVEN_161735-1 [Araneus ventricosus]